MNAPKPKKISEVKPVGKSIQPSPSVRKLKKQSPKRESPQKQSVIRKESSKRRVVKEISSNVEGLTTAADAIASLNLLPDDVSDDSQHGPNQEKAIRYETPSAIVESNPIVQEEIAPVAVYEIPSSPKSETLSIEQDKLSETTPPEDISKEEIVVKEEQKSEHSTAQLEQQPQPQNQAKPSSPESVTIEKTQVIQSADTVVDEKAEPLKEEKPSSEVVFEPETSHLEEP